MPGLVLSRLKGEAVFIGQNIVVRVVEIRRDRVRLLFDAPKDIPVLREEVAERNVRQYIGDVSREVIGAIADAVCADVPNRVIEDALDAAENERL
jgi:carbon storage regulator